MFQRSQSTNNEQHSTHYSFIRHSFQTQIVLLQVDEYFFWVSSKNRLAGKTVTKRLHKSFKQEQVFEKFLLHEDVPNDYILFKFEIKKKKVLYIAQIMVVHEEKYHILFMRKITGKINKLVFSFPKEVDAAFIKKKKKKKKKRCYTCTTTTNFIWH